MGISVGQLLEAKGRNIFWIAPDASVYDAVKLITEKGVDLVLVMEDEKVVGVISERDYARKIILVRKRSRETAVREIMTARVVFGRPDLTIEEAMSIMTERHFRHLPILDGGRVVGVVSIGDLVKAAIADQQFRIEQLESYISG
jgi:CBS domain-containing protein